LADFRDGGDCGWQAGGWGLADRSPTCGELALEPTGETLVRGLLPRGRFTHALSDKLNGTLRSPPLRQGKRHVSFEVLGRRSSAVRLVSNHCQLNYKNYRALTRDELHWVTLELPPDADSLRVYAELMTMLDNPKFPDQLSALGGDKENYRLPWEKAAADPRSHWGITRAVLHDRPEPPSAELGHVRRLFAAPDRGSTGGTPSGSAAPETAGTASDVPPASREELAERYTAVISAALGRWGEGRATDDDVRWLDVLVRRGLFGNRSDLSPRLATAVREARRWEAELPTPRVAPGIADCGEGFDQPVFLRGDCAKPGERAERRYLEVLSAPGARFQGPGSGRLELARQLTDPANPLTARVMVNRVWHHLFGTGLVRTVDDFGHVGELPSHPELLDYLAAEFVRPVPAAGANADIPDGASRRGGDGRPGPGGRSTESPAVVLSGPAAGGRGDPRLTAGSGRELEPELLRAEHPSLSGHGISRPPVVLRSARWGRAAEHLHQEQPHGSARLSGSL